MGYSVNDSGNNALILNKLGPLGEWIVGGIESAGGFIAGADYLEQEAGSGGVIWQKPDFIQKEQPTSIKCFCIGSKGFVRLGLAHFVNEIGGAFKADAIATFNRLIADGDGGMGFSEPGRADRGHICLFINKMARS